MDNNSHTSKLLFTEYSLATPIGNLIIWLSTEQVLQFVGWQESKQETLVQLINLHGVEQIELTVATDSHKAIQALECYFNGEITAIDELAVAQIGTPFQRLVWQALRTIPAGETISYGELAQQIGNPLACRAVGMANNRNPISIVVPCHRVIGKNKQLVGYGSGLERKQWLLDHERHYKGT